VTQRQAEQRGNSLRAIGSGAAAGFSLLALVLCAIWAANFLLFHTLAEMFSVVVGIAAGVVAWYSRDWTGRNYLLLIGLASLFVGALDTVHTLGYKGMPIFDNHGGNLSSQLWLSARTLEAGAFLVAVWQPHRRYRVDLLVAILGIVVVALGATVFADVWPRTFVEGVGVTPFKLGFELTLAAAFVGVLFLLRRRAADFDPQIHALLVLCVGAKIVTELSFSWYTDLYGVANFLGHAMKIVGSWLFLKAVVDTGLRRPQALIFGAMAREKNLSDEVARHAATLDAVLDATVDPVVMFDAHGRMLFVSRAAERFFGRTSRELAARTWREAGLPEEVMGPLERLAFAVQEQCRTLTEEIVLSARRGGTCLELQVSPVGGEGAGGTVACIRDISARKAMEEELKASLSDNRVLMMEVHHRVKNNLQIVSSILQMQGWRMTDPALRAKFEEACGRILSLAKVHELLYKQESAASVDFVLYARMLCGDLFRMYGVRDDWVELKVEAGSLPLPVDRAEPLALILHELVSNALKHAFTEEKGGQLTIRLSTAEAGEGLLMVADNGTKTGRRMDFEGETAALGLRMVDVLVKQIRGTRVVRRSSGTEVEVRFPLTEPVRLAEAAD